jgi:hypothetical protein
LTIIVFGTAFGVCCSSAGFVVSTMNGVNPGFSDGKGAFNSFRNTQNEKIDQTGLP